jgi:hypothetical protein
MQGTSMINTLPQTLTLAMPAIDGVTLHHKGLNYLRPELLLDFVTISEQPMLLSRLLPCSIPPSAWCVTSICAEFLSPFPGG